MTACVLSHDTRVRSCVSPKHAHRQRTFAILCHLLRTVSRLSSIEIVDIEEMVAMFLHVLANDVKNRFIQREFVQCGETVSQHFNLVLLAFVRLYEELIKRPVPVTNNCNDQRWKCFENCLGALDGTYIKVNVPAADRPTFKTRKGEIATNVLGVYDTKGDFIYVLAGWEGSAAYSRILRDALARGNGLQVPKGYYYLYKTGYPNAEGCLGPYRGQRYHLQEWRDAGNAPTNAKEYFNMKHYSVRNVIECAFGVLKVKELLNKPFPYYDELTYVFGRDRVTGRFVETFADMGSNEPGGYERFDTTDGNEEFPSVYSQGIDMSQDDVRAS
ncbi:retrotransposon protein [Cucumis melo var. makuwa]|uniref:Retrotransposon protein n=1 Tax=Cucumis melo var. makuwa TaxID=1194695 RepID=A0A5A7VEW5_CUCMM|nr:retrotransposon protein [Cucumis melo var. makuwa]TYJ97674.1 retrotransposon protein [Cucumis melo var. makuwa]